MALRELPALVVEVLCDVAQQSTTYRKVWHDVPTCCRKMVEHSPWSAIPNLNRREVDRVEVDVVLPHELEQADVLVIEPPFLPFRCVVGCNTGVS